MRSLWTITRLLLDIASMKLFVRLVGQRGELLDSHLFLYVRYSELAEQCERRGLSAMAAQFFAIAEAHFQAAPDDDPPEAAAAAMPVPRPPIKTNAVSTKKLGRTPTGPSDLTPSPTP